MLESAQYQRYDDPEVTVPLTDTSTMVDGTNVWFEAALLGNSFPQRCRLQRWGYRAPRSVPSPAAIHHGVLHEVGGLTLEMKSPRRGNTERPSAFLCVLRVSVVEEPGNPIMREEQR